MPSASSGIIAVPVTALLAVSGPATPAIAPLPNCSGCPVRQVARSHVRSAAGAEHHRHLDRLVLWKLLGKQRRGALKPATATRTDNPAATRPIRRMPPLHAGLRHDVEFRVLMRIF
jgi:hypothetical protein